MKNTVTEAVTVKLSNLGEAVKEKLIGVLVDRELNKRTESLVSAMDKLDKLAKEQRKLAKPTTKLFGQDGATIVEAFDKAALEALNKNKAEIAKLEKAINKAIDENDYSDVYNIIGKGGSSEEG